MKYSLDGTNWTDITSSTDINLTGLSVGTIKVVKKGNGTTTIDSDPQSITVTKAETPNLTVTQPTVVGGKGTVATTTSHEYSSDNGSTWTTCTANQEFAVGTYLIRVKASGTVLASGNQAVTINPIISVTVTFKVVNGSWNEGEGEAATADKTVTLTGNVGDALKLSADQIPAVGNRPSETYKTGSWNTTPSTETEITNDTTYTYTYAAKEAAVVTKAPEAKTLTYTGSAQELVTAGTATGGTMQYALGNATEATQPYTTSIPTGTDAGTYYVWYKASGNSDYEESEPGCVEVTIREDGQPDNDEGNINVETFTEDGAPDCGLEVPDDTLDSLLTEEEKERLNSGEAVLFYLDVSNTDPSETDKSLIESKLKEISSDAQVGMFFDMSFYKQVGNDPNPEKITDLNGKKVNVLIDVPKELQNAESGKTRIFYVVRIHNGVAEIIAESTNTPIPVESDKFSTYAILYEDVEKSTGSSYEHHHHICERGHIFNYHVFQEPTTETDGYAGWVCDRCGIQDPDHADYVGPTGYIVLSAFPVFNDTLEKNIAAAPENGTVSISTKRWMSVRRGVLEALAARPDVTLSISFVYEGSEYELTMKGSDPALAEYLASSDLFYGFIYLGNGFGLEKKTAEVPQS